MYVKRTLGMVRILGVNGLESLQTWADVLCAVHRDLKSNTGGVMSLGHGVFHHKSSEQELNTKSSTEAKLGGC